VPHYRQYVRSVTAWATHLRISPADTESLIFRDATAADSAGQWHDATFTNAPPTPEQPSALSADDVAVLDALGEAADAFAARPSTSPHDTEDFECGVRALRRIILAPRAHQAL
jgi:hypothetical protein